MINMHPQRWTDDSLLWTQELIAQNVKNVVKRALILYRNRYMPVNHSKELTGL
jgi:hypothetical protein